MAFGIDNYTQGTYANTGANTNTAQEYLDSLLGSWGATHPDQPDGPPAGTNLLDQQAYGQKGTVRDYLVSMGAIDPSKPNVLSNPDATHAGPDSSSTYGDMLKIAGTFAALIAGAGAVSGAIEGGAAGVGDLATTDLAGTGGVASLGGAAATTGGAAGTLATSMIDAGVNAVSSAVGDTATGAVGTFDPSTFLNSVSGSAPDSAAAVNDAFGSGTISADPATAAAQTSGISTNASQFLNPPAPSVADLQAQGVLDANGNFVQPTGAPAQPQGLVQRTMDFLDKSKWAGPALGQVVGGIGKGLLDASTQDKKIAAAKEIAQNQVAWDLAAKRAAVAGSGYFGQKVGFAPNANATLRRPDGTLVYAQPGLITGAMQPPP